MSLISVCGRPLELSSFPRGYSVSPRSSDDPESAIGSFLQGCGLKMTTYFQFGEKLDVEPFYCVVEAKKDGQGPPRSHKSSNGRGCTVEVAN